MLGKGRAGGLGKTPKTDSATQSFLTFNTDTGAFLKFHMRHGHVSDMQQGYFLSSTSDIGLEIISDIQQGYFRLATGDRAIFLATLTCEIVIFLN